MPSWLKFPHKGGRRKENKEDSKDAFQHPQYHVKRDEISSSHSPRLERARNLRWHLDLDVPKLSMSVLGPVSNRNGHNLLSLSAPVSPTGASQITSLPYQSNGQDDSVSSHAVSQDSRPSDARGNLDRNRLKYDDSETSSSTSSPESVIEDLGQAYAASALVTQNDRQVHQQYNSLLKSSNNASETVKRGYLLSVDSAAQHSSESHVNRRWSTAPNSTLPSPGRRPTPYQNIVIEQESDRSSSNLNVMSAALEEKVQYHNPSQYQITRKSPVQSPRRTPQQTPQMSPIRSPLQSPGRTPQQSPGRTPQQSPGRTPQQSPGRTPQQSPRRTPLHSPRRSPLSSPKRMSRAISPQHSIDSQSAHPLPLPPGLRVDVSHRSGITSAHSSEDSGRGDQIASGRWPNSPARSGPASPSGKWLKGTLLGSGSFGKVYRGIHSETGELCAIKEVEIIEDDRRSKESAKQLHQEIKLLSNMRHPNILHYKGSEMVGGSLYIYLELVSGGSLYKLLQEFGTFSEPLIRRYTREILLGLQYLHERKIVHRDIKCANVLLGQDGIKVADFGMAKIIGTDPSPLSFKGSPFWMAPELIRQSSGGPELAVDIWSLGCTVIEMATGKPPFASYEGYAAMFKVMNCQEVPLPDSLSSTGKNFLHCCLQTDPFKRLTAAALLRHPFVQLENNGTDSFIQSVKYSLSEVMLDRMNPRDTKRRVSDADLAQSRYNPNPNSRARACSSGPASPRHYYQSRMHMSRSALQLSSQQYGADIQVERYHVRGNAREDTLRNGPPSSSARLYGAN